MKKLFKIVLVAVMALGLAITNVDAETVTGKAGIGVWSGDTEATVIVNSDYSIDASIHGKKVNASEITIGVALEDVASLGVEGVKEKYWTLTTNSAFGDVDLNNWVYSALENVSFKVNATVQGLPTTYNFVGTKGTDSYSLVGTTDEVAARAAYHEAVSHLKVSVNDKADSFAKVKAGSYVQIGTEKLVVVKDGTLDNIGLNQGTESAIKDLVELQTASSAANVIYLPAGTALCVGDDQVELLCPATITITGVAINDPILSEIRDGSESVDALLTTLIPYLGYVNDLDGATIGVDVDFACTTTTITEPATCTKDGKETVVTSCGKVVSEKLLPATGHKYENGACTVCGEKEPVKAPETGDATTVALYSMLLVLAAGAFVVLRKQEA